MKRELQFTKQFFLIFILAVSSFGYSQNVDATWGANDRNRWYNTGNWANNAYPGVQGNATVNNNTATFTSAHTSTQSTINMGTASLNLGAIIINSSRTSALTLASQSSAGSLRLYGATVNAVPNVIIDHSGSNTYTIIGNDGGSRIISVVLTNANNLISTNGTGNVVISATISGAGGLNKVGSGAGIVTLSGANTYTGGTKITTGELRFNPSANTSQSGTLDLNGGTLSTVGIANGRTLTFANVTLTENSTISLNTTNSNRITFITAGSFNFGKTLTISGWQGSAGTAGTVGRIFVGTSANGLTATQLSQINFTGFAPGAVLLNTGELVPSNSISWTGAVNNLWSVAGNWSGGVVPNGTRNVFITTGSPLLDVNYTVAAGTSLVLNGQASLTVSPTSTLTIAGTALFNDRNVILKSDATGTAAIGQVTGTLSRASNVTVERYITGRRAFRFLTPGVTTTASIFQNWQNGGVATSGIGTHITGGANGGFDVTTTNNASIHTYNAQAAGTTTGFTTLLNTDATVLKAGVGYRLLVRGDRTVDLSAAAQPNMNTATTLSATGTLTTGTVVFDATSPTSPVLVNNNPTNTQTNGYTLIGNPYASPVDWNAVTKTGVKNNAYYTWDPTLGTTAQRGRYVVYSADNGQTNLLDDSSSLMQTNRQFLQSGQAVFIQNANLAVPATVTFQESHKATTNSYVFRSASEGLATTTASKLFLSVYEPNELAIGGAPIDGALAVFASNYTTALDINDVTKLTASGENVAFVREDKNLAIETLAPVTSNDELFVKTIAFQANKNYTFKINAQDFDTTATAKIVDLYLNTETPIDLTQPSFVTFNTTTDAASFGANRFKIVFNSAALANESFNLTSVAVYPNPIVNNEFTIALPSSVSGLVTVTMRNMLGQEVFRTSASATPTMSIQPTQQLDNGIYVVTIDTKGKMVQTKVIVKN